jgi:predicted house-cleaning noncanonical NTP pyrophosphatase (MazG superfamily)
MNEDEFTIEINKKMHEELTEYEAAETAEDAIEELADLLELIHAAVVTHGSSFDELEKVRLQKAEKRGGFDERIFLIDVEDE